MTEALSLSSGRAFCTVYTTPLTLVVSSASRSSSVISPSRATLVEPALATTMSRPFPAVSTSA
jgi:hypothetical protein